LTELEQLRPRSEQLRRDAVGIDTQVASLGRRIEEALATLEGQGRVLRGFASEAKAISHKMRSLHTSIGSVLDALDRLAPQKSAGTGGRA
jgi:prefoldin subunit 5